MFTIKELDVFAEYPFLVLEGVQVMGAFPSRKLAERFQNVVSYDQEITDINSQFAIDEELHKRTVEEIQARRISQQTGIHLLDHQE